MVKKVKQALAKVASGLTQNRPLLARAQRRYEANRKRAFKANEQKKAAQVKADRFRSQGHVARAARKDKKALRLASVAYKNSQRAQFWLGRVKQLTQRIEKLETRQEDLEAELKKLSGVTIKGNHATGGTPRERLKAVALASAAACASGKRPNFYSQPGSWNVDRVITGESSGMRSDCSQWFTSVYKACGLEDPNGTGYTGGYTGTLVAQGKRISESELQPGDAIIYGSGTGFHVEMYVGPGNKTIGHGSAPIDPGVINLTGNGDYRCYSYL